MANPLIAQYRLQVRYNQWFNGKLYDACERLSDDERKLPRGAFFGSIHNTLNHLAVTDQVWLRRLAAQGTAFAALNDTVLNLAIPYDSPLVAYPEWPALRAKRTQLDAAMVAWIAEMPDEFPLCRMRYKNAAGVEREHGAWQAITHLFNHQTHHRGQACTLLTQAGIELGMTDMIAVFPSPSPEIKPGASPPAPGEVSDTGAIEP